MFEEQNELEDELEDLPFNHFGGLNIDLLDMESDAFSHS